MVPADARRILHEGAALLDALGLAWWLSAGTVLGAWREGFSDEWLARDTDIDVGVLGDDAYAAIKEAFERAGFAVHTTYQWAGHWPQLAMVKDGVIFDIYFFLRHGGLLVNTGSEGIMTKPAAMIDRRASLIVDGKDYPAPAPVEAYLRLRYGPDWRTPHAKRACWAEEAANLIPWSKVRACV